jgi:predicted MFS family arabinose efflux permease
VRPERLLLVAAFASTVDRVVIPPMLLTLAVALDVPFTRAALLASAYYLAYGGMQLVWGLVAARIGRVRLLRLTMTLGAIAGGLSALAPGYTSLLLARAVTGGLLGAVIPTVIIYVGDTIPVERRQHALADMAAAIALATSAGIALGGVCASFLSWRVGFALPAVLVGVLTVFVRRLPEPDLAARPPVRAQLAMVLGHRWTWALLPCVLVEGAIAAGVVTYLAPALQSVGFGAATAGLAVALYGLSDVGWTRVARLALRRLGAPGMILVGGGLFVAGFSVGAASQTLPGIALAGALIGGGWMFMHSSFQTWATMLVPPARAITLALFATALFAGSSLGTAALAPLADRGDFTTLFAVAAAVAVPLGLCGSALRRAYGATIPPVAASGAGPGGTARSGEG